MGSDIKVKVYSPGAVELCIGVNFPDKDSIFKVAIFRPVQHLLTCEWPM